MCFTHILCMKPVHNPKFKKHFSLSCICILQRAVQNRGGQHKHCAAILLGLVSATCYRRFCNIFSLIFKTRCKNRCLNFLMLVLERHPLRIAADIQIGSCSEMHPRLLYRVLCHSLRLFPLLLHIFTEISFPSSNHCCLCLSLLGCHSAIQLYFNINLKHDVFLHLFNLLFYRNIQLHAAPSRRLFCCFF